MQIVFQKLRYQNFLSTGNQFTEIIFNRSKSTLVVGENGAGKSTMLDALFYVLYGKAFRNINKPQLINSITNKNLLVECEFSIGKKQYLIRRGMRHNIFEIHINGEMIDQNSDIREYQDILSKNILKMSDKSFRQIVVLGSANYQPFMQLSAGDRRQVIEDLLDIQIFSVMNSILKEKISQNKIDTHSADYEIKMVEQRIELNEKHAKSLKSNNNELIIKKNNLILEVTDKISHSNIEINMLSGKVNEFMSKIKDSDKTNVRVQKILDLEKKIEGKVRSIKKEIGFFENHDSCPTCEQDIDARFKTGRLELRESQLVDTEEALLSLEKEYTKASERIVEITAINNDINALQSKIQDHMTDIRLYNNNIEALKSEIEELKNDTTQINLNSEEIKTLKKEKKDKVKHKYDLVNKKRLHDISSMLLKDSGIKTKIIRQYIPIINKLVNKYLQAMDFFVNFEIDEKFNETIRSRFRDEFSYASFSEGEKMRIDLSLMFTWRSIAKLRNSASTNILIMDEVFDSSLDSNGTEEFLKILETLTQETNVFIISHKGDVLYDKFHSVIKFEKHLNFSRIAA